MKKLTGLLICILLQHYSATAQSFAINTDGSAANASAMLDVKSVTKGILIPRMTKTERNSIISPATGLMIFQTGPDSIGFHYYNGSSWSWVSSSSNGSDWKLTGNSGTNAANFIGTTDNLPLRFRVNNTPSGEINGFKQCVYLGLSSGNAGSGNYNVGVGDKSMQFNSTGSWNTAVGTLSLNHNFSGSENTALGQQALYNNTTGSGNIATGLNSLSNNISGSSNSGYGNYAASEITTGNNNAAFGNHALNTNKFGSYNTAVGDSADVLNNNLTNATAIGAKSTVNCNNCLVLGSVNGTNSATSNVNVGIGTTTPDALLHVQRGAVLFDSTIGGTPVSGAGTRMMWIPAKAAFRAGKVLGSEWDDSNIGLNSFASGQGNLADGDNSTAIGIYTHATGLNSFASGDVSIATGANSTAMGFNTLASNTGSTAIGNSSTASGAASVALGNGLLASGGYSMALGYNNTSSADRSISIGSFNKSSGAFSFSSGYFTKSKSFSGFTTGTFNDSTNAANPNNFNTLNRIFEIGNGTADNARKNAMTVLQNGNVGIGVLNPAAKLHVSGNEMALHGLEAGIQITNLAGANNWNIRAGGTGTATPSGGFSIADDNAYRLVIDNNGDVGIGTLNPVVPLNFAATTGDKIALWTNGTTHYGFGIQASLLQIYTESSGNDIAFGYGNSAAFTENVRIKGNGTTVTKGLQVSNGTVFTKMQSGSATVGSSATAQKIITIIFPVGFASATPKVFATARNEPASSFTDAFSVSVRSITATSVTLNVQRTDSITGWGQNLLLDWFAVE
jgi:hypothetical protein